MREREKLRQLHEIAAVRDAQEGAAKMRAGQAQRLRTSAAEGLDEGAANLAERQAAWSRSLEEPLMSLDIITAWSTAVVEGSATLEQLRVELASADREAARLSLAWGQAQLQSETARSLSAKAARRLNKARDEAAQDQAADRAAYRQVSS